MKLNPMIKSVLLAWTLTFSFTAQACTCGFAPLNTEATRHAKNVFIFRLSQAKVNLISGNKRSGAEIIGRIKIIDRLRGVKKLPEQIRFSTDSCCGTRLDVGSYFVAFISDAGSQFVAHKGNVMEVGREYALSRTKTREKILSVLDGKEKLEDFFPGSFEIARSSPQYCHPVPGKR
ncbi:hypothetical protein PO883_15265 [Massilia sp. DJPM01]|uniref:hypothetical protein n=1 Tax=Massilia sp. DJPM01 TaxID=3024404 RepID=UPI00259D50B6|nr:hypothetical protein [Massilia sp. DJPM01]MDM5178557.1 hypothetical protein [Massilia sp. DJPM01]